MAQGDVLEAVEFFHPVGGSYRDTVTVPGIVVSHSCDFTKFRADARRGREGLDRFPLLVAPVLRAEQIPDPGTRGHAQAGRVARYFHVPPCPPLDETDHFVDFWFIQPAAAFELLDIRRLTSMSDYWQKRLQRALDRFFSWEARKAPLEVAP